MLLDLKKTIEYLAHAKHSYILLTVYFFLTAFLWFVGLSPWQTALTMYHFVVPRLDNYLQTRTSGLDLDLVDYAHYDGTFIIVGIICTLIGFGFCISASKKMPFTSWLKRAILLSGYLTIKLALYTALFYLAALGSVAVYFAKQLLELEPMEATGNLFQRAVAKFNPFNMLKAGWTALVNLMKAQDIFQTMNAASYGIYLIAMLIGVINLALFFILLTRYINQSVKHH